MTSQPSTGRRGRQAGGEVGLRQLLESAQANGANRAPGEAPGGSNPAPGPSNPAPDRPNPAAYESSPAPYGSSPAAYGSDPVRYGSNPARHASNSAQYESNSTPYESNPVRYETNPVQYGTNSAQYEPNPSQHGSNQAPYESNPAHPSNPAPGRPNPAPYEPNQAPEWVSDSAPTEPLRVTTPASNTHRARPAEPRPPGRRPISGPPPKRFDRTTIRRAGLAVGAVCAVVGIAYGIDLALSSGEVPRGTVVAGIDVGGMATAAADERLRAELGPRTERELPLRIGDVQTRMIPSAAGLSVDWDRTWARVGGQPLNPITRFTSLFSARDVAVVSVVDDVALDRQLEALRVHDRPSVEGTIAFDKARPVAVAPVPGRVLDIAAARRDLIDEWISGLTVDLPVHPAPLNVRPEAVDIALRTVAEPAVRAPITFAGKGAAAKLDPEQIATTLSFAPDGNGGLALAVDQNIAVGLLAPQLAATEVEAKDATFALTGGKPTVVPAVVGDKINWPKTLEQYTALLTAPGERAAQAVYEKVEPKLTTEAAQGLGVVETMGSFTTNGFSGPSGVNIRVVAKKVNGAVVKPGDTFSLNDFTGPRGAAEGYVESGIIDHGRPATAVGGGISQFATTLYNAAYFAGMEDAGHTEHSYYISRYPAAREATVFDGAIDLRFRNNTPTGVFIEALATDSEVTVRLWGTKTLNVESVTGEKSKPTEPSTIKLPKGKDCIASEGAPGFTISDTRIITDRRTGKEVSRATRTVKYDPIPVVKCE
ncbi:VanW family protein [Nocardia brasiliensis]|uniref:VanW family protein n=1 Tax=Nocardia brasiliensis TaxID=37326 RepID=UPI0037A33620